jgi:hypothetical protein
MSTVTKLDVATKPARKPAKRKSKTVKKLAAKMSAVKLGIGGMIVALLAVTLWHSSEGFILLTGCPIWQGWALALGIDGLYGSVKAAMLTHPECDTKVGNALITISQCLPQRAGFLARQL